MCKEREYLKIIEEKLRHWDGHVGFYYENLKTGERLAYNEYDAMLAASTIKVPIMAAVFYEAAGGRLNLSERYVLQEADKMPSCGCLNRMQAGLPLQLIDLVNLMIILSDNTATNILIRRIGMVRINEILEGFGCHVLRVNRLLFDGEAAAKGLENKVSAYELSDLMKRMYAGELVSAEASGEMLEIMKNQRLNSKLPFAFEEKADIAHKTGEDSGITHDFGIVYGAEPFVIACLGNEVNAPAYNRFMQETAWGLYRILNES